MRQYQLHTFVCKKAGTFYLELDITNKLIIRGKNDIVSKFVYAWLCIVNNA